MVLCQPRGLHRQRGALIAGGLLGLGEASGGGVELQRAGAATGGDLGVDAGWVGEGEPEGAAGNEWAVAMGELGGELGFCRRRRCRLGSLDCTRRRSKTAHSLAT
jgi:hypothetical protein